MDALLAAVSVSEGLPLTETGFDCASVATLAAAAASTAADADKLKDFDGGDNDFDDDFEACAAFDSPQMSVVVQPDSEQRDRKRRFRIPADSLAHLKHLFELNPRPSQDELIALSLQLSIDERKIKIWFQNMRTRKGLSNSRSPPLNNLVYHQHSSVSPSIPAAASRTASNPYAKAENSPLTLPSTLLPSATSSDSSTSQYPPSHQSAPPPPQRFVQNPAFSQGVKHDPRHGQPHQPDYPPPQSQGRYDPNYQQVPSSVANSYRHPYPPHPPHQPPPTHQPQQHYPPQHYDVRYQQQPYQQPGPHSYNGSYHHQPMPHSIPPQQQQQQQQHYAPLSYTQSQQQPQHYDAPPYHQPPQHSQPHYSNETHNHHQQQGHQPLPHLHHATHSNVPSTIQTHETSSPRAAKIQAKKGLNSLSPGGDRRSPDDGSTPSEQGAVDSPGSGFDYKKAKRFIMSREHLKWLKKVFEETPFPTAEQMQHISEVVGMDRRQVRVWFQNRRAVEKRKGNTVG
ncbi:hypothetical protein BCR33DRAFT_711640 [Rhizoclosmatium globosum]|uniref:Homeobox domain-containing protein n=1 Tax=Rhizoclosmatium globosum TaxID=329046 RepID=A0A1Y2CZ74_9FUNG|nr:hypothetical protein BCR33DRAFT_711640 [Rhizoclosmatium globosum]|eukprot:ORY52300.1 hypothetical protein BCR33DRAFT_711640 [Rhizoclosmatium globosum]